MTVREEIRAFVHFNRLCDFGGRFSGTESERKALDYASGVLEGLKAGRLTVHPTPYDGWSSQGAWIEDGDRKLSAVALPRSTSLPQGGAELQLVDAGRGTLEDIDRLAEHLAGRAVIVRHEYMFAPDHIHRRRKLERALGHGATLFIIANSLEGAGVVTGGIRPSMPAIGVDASTAAELRAAAAAGRPLRFHLQTRHEPMLTRTLDWYLPPTDREENDAELVVCAHIDGHEPAESALDNATGVAVALGIAEQYAARPLRRHGLRVLIFSAEELGLLGSAAYVATLTSEARRRIRAVLNLDSVGGSESFGAMTSGFESLEALAKAAGDATGIPIRIHKALLSNSDHYEFAREGIPALRLVAGFGEIDSAQKYVLTGGDTRDLVSAHQLELSRRLVEAMINAAEESSTQLFERT